MYKYIKNPINNKKVNLNSKMGEKILKNYLYYSKMWGGGFAENVPIIFPTDDHDLPPPFGPNDPAPNQVAPDLRLVPHRPHTPPPDSTSIDHKLDTEKLEAGLMTQYKYYFDDSTFVSVFPHSENTQIFLQKIDEELVGLGIGHINNTQLFQVTLVKSDREFWRVFYNNYCLHPLMTIDEATGNIVVPRNTSGEPQYTRINCVKFRNLDQYILEYCAQLLMQMDQFVRYKPPNHKLLVQFHYHKNRGLSETGGSFHKDNAVGLNAHLVQLSFRNANPIQGTEVVSSTDLGNIHPPRIIRPLIPSNGTIMFTNGSMFHASPSPTEQQRHIRIVDVNRRQWHSTVQDFRFPIHQTRFTSLQNPQDGETRPDFLRIWVTDDTEIPQATRNLNGIYIGDLNYILAGTTGTPVVGIRAVTRRPAINDAKPDEKMIPAGEEFRVNKIQLSSLEIDRLPQRGGSR